MITTLNAYTEGEFKSLKNLKKQTDFSYLKFDVNEYVKLDNIVELPIREINMDKYKFDVNDYVSTQDSLEMIIK